MQVACLKYTPSNHLCKQAAKLEAVRIPSIIICLRLSLARDGTRNQPLLETWTCPLPTGDALDLRIACLPSCFLWFSLRTIMWPRARWSFIGGRDFLTLAPHALIAPAFPEHCAISVLLNSGGNGNFSVYMNLVSVRSK